MVFFKLFIKSFGSTPNLGTKQSFLGLWRFKAMHSFFHIKLKKKNYPNKEMDDLDPS